MTVAKLERWIRLLPSHERTQPALTVDGVQLTPEDMLREARAGTELGLKAQNLWESGALGTEDELLIKRIENRLARYPPDKPLFHVLGTPNLLTPADILANVKAGTEAGVKWLDAEHRYLEYLDKLRERA